MSEVPSLPAPDALDLVCRLKYGPTERAGWGPRMRARLGYHNPDDLYEAMVDALLADGDRWLDVGCGRDLFPCNRPLAQQMAGRAGLLVGVDPAPTLAENDLVHERVAMPVDELESDQHFDLITMRMVAEHVEHPDRVVAALARVAAPGCRVVVYTPYRWSPVPIGTALLPFALHQPIKRVLWRTASADTFPTRFRMNTRRTLAAWMGACGFAEHGFWYLDDCRTTARFRALQWCELRLRRGLRGLGLRYPERCLLGIYRRA